MMCKARSIASMSPIASLAAERAGASGPGWRACQAARWAASWTASSLILT